MPSPAELLDMIREIKREIGLQTSSDPDIRDIHYDEDQDELIIVAADRPDKAIVIGPGGWVVGKLREKLGVGTIHVEAYTDLVARKLRVNQTLERLQQLIHGVSSDIKGSLEDKVKRAIKSRLSYPWKLPQIPEEKENRALVAISGGKDSAAALILTKRIGLNPIAMTVNPGTIILPKHLKENVENMVGYLKIRHLMVEPTQSWTAIIENAIEKGHHPCGKCHNALETEIYKKAREIGVPFVVFGDLLPTGTQAIKVLEENFLRMNILAALAMTKTEARNIVNKTGVVFHPYGYGCPLLNKVHTHYPHQRGFSIQRVLREVRAGVVEPGEGLKLIRSILRG